MKKFLLIGLIVGLVLILVGGAGVVYARVRNLDYNASVQTNIIQNRDRLVEPFGYGPGGMMNGYGYGPGGMMGGNRPWGMMGGRGYGLMHGAGIMHDYMISAFAKAVGLTVEQVDTRLANGETFKQIAIAQGKSETDLPALAKQVRQDAMNKAVSDGVITQSQADRMLEYMNQYSVQGFDFDDCPMWDGDEVQP